MDKIDQSSYKNSRFLVNSLPKSGTHLLGRVLSFYPETEFSMHLGAKMYGYHIWRRLGVSLNMFNYLTCWLKKQDIPIGVDLPRYASERYIYRALSNVPFGSFATAHLPYSAVALNLLTRLQYKLFIMIRDPRDVAVSFSHYVIKLKSHPLNKYFAEISPEERLLIAINGIEANGLYLRPLVSRFDAIMDWVKVIDCLLVSFEDLVGEKGGGAKSEQLKQIISIGSFLGLTPMEFDAAYIAEHAFSSSSSNFRKGKIGAWKDEFQEAHIQAINISFGERLVTLGYE